MQAKKGVLPGSWGLGLAETLEFGIREAIEFLFVWSAPAERSGDGALTCGGAAGPQGAGFEQKQTKILAGLVTFVSFCRVFPWTRIESPRAPRAPREAKAVSRCACHRSPYRAGAFSAIPITFACQEQTFWKTLTFRKNPFLRFFAFFGGQFISAACSPNRGLIRMSAAVTKT